MRAIHPRWGEVRDGPEDIVYVVDAARDEAEREKWKEGVATRVP